MCAQFSPPVVVCLGPANSMRVVVNDAIHAAQLLDDEWPVEIDIVSGVARAACQDAVNGGDPGKARCLFERAAAKAGILDN